MTSATGAIEEEKISAPRYSLPVHGINSLAPPSGNYKSTPSTVDCILPDVFTSKQKNRQNILEAKHYMLL